MEGECSTQERWHLWVVQEMDTAQGPWLLSLQPPPCIRPVFSEPLALCQSPGGVPANEILWAGPLRGHLLFLPDPLSLWQMESPLIFTARPLPGSSTLGWRAPRRVETPCSSGVTFVAEISLWVWGQPFLSLCPCYHFGCDFLANPWL